MIVITIYSQINKKLNNSSATPSPNIDAYSCAERLKWLAATLQRLQIIALGNMSNPRDTPPPVIIPLNKNFLNRLITEAQQEAVQWKKLNALVDNFPQLLEHTSRTFLARSILTVAKYKAWSVSSFLKHFKCAQIDNLPQNTIRALQALNQTYQTRAQQQCQQAQNDAKRRAKQSHTITQTEPARLYKTLTPQDHLKKEKSETGTKNYLTRHLPCNNYTTIRATAAVMAANKKQARLYPCDTNLDTDYTPLAQLCDQLLLPSANQIRFIRINSINFDLLEPLEGFSDSDNE